MCDLCLVLFMLRWATCTRVPRRKKRAGSVQCFVGGGRSNGETDSSLGSMYRLLLMGRWATCARVPHRKKRAGSVHCFVGGGRSSGKTPHSDRCIVCCLMGRWATCGESHVGKSRRSDTMFGGWRVIYSFFLWKVYRFLGT